LENALASLIGNVAIVLAVIVSVLTLIDWLLTKTQKERLSDKAIAVWMWLDDHRSVDFLRKFKDYREQVKLSATLQIFITCGLVVAAILSWYGGGPGNYFAIWVAVGAAVTVPPMVWVVHPAILKWMTQGDSSLGYFVRSTISVLPIVIVTIIFREDILMIWPTPRNSFYFEHLSALRSGLFGVFMVYSSVVLYLWYINIALFGAWLLSIMFFGASRFVLVRVVENPKGIVLGLSALVAGIGAVLKAILGK
jgi:hypothetical protein